MSCRLEKCGYRNRPEPCPFHAQGQEARDYEVSNPEIEAILRALAHILKSKMPMGWGFSLFMFDFNNYKNGSAFYISSAEREDFLRSLQEFMVRNGYVLMPGPTSTGSTETNRN